MLANCNIDGSFLFTKSNYLNLTVETRKREKSKIRQLGRINTIHVNV